MINEITKDEVLTLAEESLHLPKSGSVDETLVANCLRRIASYKCPCSINALISEGQRSLKFLSDNDSIYQQEIERIINLLIVGGDFLELTDVVTPESNVKGTWIFVAPPSFVIRPNGTIFLFGIGPDGDIPISSLLDRVNYDGCKRFLISLEMENLPDKLTDYGLSQISESSWLKLPRKSTAQQCIEEFDNLLASASLSEHIPEVMVLDRGKWISATAQNGKFIARRPQWYGPKSWCYAEVENGRVRKFIDFPLRYNGIPQRQCDVAWLLQLAIDENINKPQEFTMQVDGLNSIFSFYSPIPLWAERRLLAMGQATKQKNCLFSYIIPNTEALAEEAFLCEYLWLKRKDITL
ncbi:hypothetical protein ACEN9X_09450 [Mucilaginibacter sp. Mucisp86]|uniref:hypothetical protein n=1 Tax=Mucilaginibacter sp. Mucisp86 TaxID=3243060 RepID=UPI0039B4E661